MSGKVGQEPKNPYSQPGIQLASRDYQVWQGAANEWQAYYQCQIAELTAEIKTLMGDKK